MVDPKETINIENVVASTGIGQELDLQSVAMDLEGADYDPEQFPGLVYRTQDPKSAALIFRSGKIVCTGAKSTDDVHQSLRGGGRFAASRIDRGQSVRAHGR